MVSKTALHAVNITFTFLGLLTASSSIGLFFYINQFTNLRSSQQYLMDHTLHWPQLVPWMFFVSGVLVVFTCSCGYAGARRNNSYLITVYGVFVTVAIIILLVVSIVALCVDNQKTEYFIKDSIYQAVYPMISIFTDDIDCSQKLPKSCCEDFEGCWSAAAYYARTGIQILSAVSIFTAVIGAVALVVAYKVCEIIEL